VKGFFEDFDVGSRYPTRTRTISDADHEAFCKVTGYEVPLFLDDAYARERGLPGRLCPSHLIMSFSSAMTGDLFPHTIVALIALDHARFIAPVQPGDTLRTEVEVLSKRPTSRADRGVIVFRDHVYNQHGHEVFCNDKTVLIRRRQAQ
jgi:acyl dehydratase